MSDDSNDGRNRRSLGKPVPDALPTSSAPKKPAGMPALLCGGRATCNGLPVSLPPGPPLLLVSSAVTPEGPPENVQSVPGVSTLSATPVLVRKGLPVQAGEPDKMSSTKFVTPSA